ncbi:PKD-like domain-containing protein [Formosa sp. PL04]|uniref:PKD-like domain-containing protein n=1 Tax=Formosa sp. PL04 TaxID=3081755 RepID=UPI0029814F35|nr:PKD-like domain-containing protein [Formosa sp. PL04]MDW5289919.1 PKD-like domain-containing protein [Formosa sp. PL04]
MKKLNFLTTNKFALLVGCSALFLACSNDEDPLLAPEVELSVEEQAVSMSMGSTITFEATPLNNTEYTNEWFIGDSLVSAETSYNFTPETSGDYALSYRAYNISGEFTFDYAITVDAFIRPTTASSIAYVTDLFEYLPAPGQFINKNPGNLESAEGVLNGATGLVTLGAWGGSITLGFDHTVINTTDENDFIVYGNAMSSFAEPGVIWVMQDENANGIADDTWYEIKGSGHDLEGTIRNYSMTYFKPASDDDDVAWEDSEGATGVVAKNAFHKQAYYPEWITEDSYTIQGTLLTSENVNMTNPTFITSAAFEYGYADNTAGGDRIDIADAINAAGESVLLSGIDFIKIQTGIQANMGWLGELSTEVKGVADLSLID